MRWTLIVCFAAAGACSTVESRHAAAPVFQTATAKSLKQFEGCFAKETSDQQVVYLPRERGGSFSSGAGPQRYIFWVVDIDDLGTTRQITVYAVNAGMARGAAIPAVERCL